ncbi:hypothetical protein TraAM80_08806 [Trypanosoma rangeli]|uniref:Uncharacterized protein n=1 Tax=Trypanosoma rangeli TaxID=5698 RepID=A0A3R7R9L1_TRYRA|nr:uncharacterized protein TraAM80_08806 [Trypanosoma rangeli]RNE98370.1 hypothetical protein TraAM80_08806 [Trypanosoma rangeli]|eukprot:RNE98370.1 hypothetical protein TraAM80_08806 [Trypanosoma rangeli]
MLSELRFQDLGDSLPQTYNGEVTSVLTTDSPFAEAVSTSAIKQNDVWSGNMFSLPDLGTDLQSELNLHNLDKSNTNNNNGDFQAAPSHTSILMQMTSKDEQLTSLTTDSKTTIAPTPSMHHFSTASAAALSNMSSAKNSTPTPPVACPMVYTPQTTQLSISSLMSVGNTTMPPNGNTNTNCVAYQQASSVAAVPNNLPAFFTAAQNGGNVMMFAPGSSPQTLCIPTTGPAMIPYYVFAPPQHGFDVNATMTCSSLPTAPQQMTPVMCGAWPPNANSVVGTRTPTPVNMPSNTPGMPSPFEATINAAAPHSIPLGFAAAEGNQRSPSISSLVQTGGEGSGASKASLRGNPPSYDSIRLQLAKRRQPPGRQRSGTNVHGSLQGICAYYSYNLSAALKQYEQPDSHVAKTVEQVLPVFIQMFPCELRDRTIIVLNRVVEATCGPDIATVVAIEPRSETSFITLIRTNNVWQLIHKLRCRVLMDRHGFWYAENMEQYLRLKEYCESVRRLPQQMRHFQTDGLPCMPLVVELSRSVNAASVTSPPAPAAV